MSEETKEKTFMVYGGARLGGDGKLWHAYYECDSTGATFKDQQMIFKNPIKADFVGSVHEVPIGARDEQGSIKSVLFGTAVYVTRFLKTEKTVEWEALHRAAKAEVELQHVFKKAASRSNFQESLDPICNAMRKTNPVGRRAIMLWVMTYLQENGRAK